MKKTINKVIKKIGHTKFAEKFTNDFLDTTATKIGLVASAVIAILGIIAFQFLPLLRHQPFGLNVPEWMCNPILATASAIFSAVLIVVGIFILVVAHCYAYCDSYEAPTEKENHSDMIAKVLLTFGHIFKRERD